MFDLNLTDKPEKFNFTVSQSTVCQGSVVTFNCSADGNPPVDTYQLLENGVPMRNGSSSPGMWSKNMSTGGVFNYKCKQFCGSSVQHDGNSYCTW